MERRLERIEENIGEMRETLAKNTALLGVNTDLLDEHIRRTDILEKHVDGLTTEARIVRWIAAAGAVIATIIQTVIMMKGH